MFNDSLKWVIRIIVTLILSMMIVSLVGGAPVTSIFYIRYTLIPILSIIMLFIVFKVDNIFGILVIFCYYNLYVNIFRLR